MLGAHVEVLQVDSRPAGDRAVRRVEQREAGRFVAITASTASATAAGPKRASATSAGWAVTFPGKDSAATRSTMNWCSTAVSLGSAARMSREFGVGMGVSFARGPAVPQMAGGSSGNTDPLPMA
jgi:hypothetical protein